MNLDPVLQNELSTPSQIVWGPLSMICILPFYQSNPFLPSFTVSFLARKLVELKSWKAGANSLPSFQSAKAFYARCYSTIVMNQNVM